MRKTLISALFAAGAVVAVASPAFSQPGIYVGPGGVEVDSGRRDYRDPPPRYREDRRDDRRGGFRIGEREARRIALRNGVDDIDVMERRGPNWVVRGETRRGRPITVMIDGIDGDVTIRR